MSNRLIRALLEKVPPEAEVKAVWMGVYATLVHGVRGGLASTFRDICSKHHDHGIDGAGELVGKPLIELAERALSPRLLDASLGMAALNAAVAPPPGMLFPERNAQEVLLEKGLGRRVVVVGAFPFLARLKDRIRRLDFIQESPENGARGVRRAQRLFRDADVIALTASSFINHTFESLLDAASHAYVIVLGATTPLSPVLFDYGVDALCGSIVSDMDAASSGVMQGAPFRKLRGIRRVTYIQDIPESGG